MSEIQQQAGWILGEITPDSPAAKAGMKPGDLITKLNGQQIKNMADSERFKAYPGTNMEFTYIRDGITKTVTVTFPKGPSFWEKLSSHETLEFRQHAAHILLHMVRKIFFGQ